MMGKVSDTFFDTLSHDGSVCRECQCGRTHFAAYAEECFEPGELEKLRENAHQQPDKFLEYDGSIVTAAFLNGKEYVYQCPCEGLAPYESFVWRNRNEIVDYITARHASEMEAVLALSKKFKNLAEVKSKAEKVHVPE
jgi:hypothetical protein